jgi:hypothetical protein
MTTKARREFLADVLFRRCSDFLPPVLCEAARNARLRLAVMSLVRVADTHDLQHVDRYATGPRDRDRNYAGANSAVCLGLSPVLSPCCSRLMRS